MNHQMRARVPLTILVYVAAPALDTHEYLLLRRTPARGGFWQGISGPVELAESLEEAAIRALSEETALTPIRLVAVDYSYTVPPKTRRTVLSSPSEHITEQVFLALLTAKVDPVIDPAQHDAWDWYIYQDALTWLRWPENVEALRRCERLISPRPANPLP
jgi:8-oxo-dGTP pyrophosphatase MutT (NUDIX family)